KHAREWKLVLLQNFDKEAETAFKEVSKDKAFKVSAETRQWMAEARSPEQPNLTFQEDWDIKLNGKTYKAVALRNSSGYKYFKHPEFGYKQLLVVVSYFDAPVNASHRIFTKVMKLENDVDEARWRNDDTWNRGHGIVSGEAI